MTVHLTFINTTSVDFLRAARTFRPIEVRNKIIREKCG
jgi:hypothetical protein